jgi:SAM-dependent methyltransferase
MADVAPDLRGRNVVHIQCHIGFDTIALARRGARLTGVDFSRASLAKAAELAERCGVTIEWVQANATALPDSLRGGFDVAYATIGAICWIEDIGAWMRSAAATLRPGGRLVLVEIHPLYAMVEAAGEPLRLDFPYAFDGPRRFDEPGSYADPQAKTVHTVTYEWNHGFAEIIDPLLRHGLRLEYLHEFPYTRGLSLPILEWGADGWQRVKGHENEFPLSFSLKMTKER